MNKEYVLITGASSGIGYEFAKLYASQGRKLILVARNIETLLELQRIYPQIEVISLDLSCLENADKLYQMTKEKGYFVDLLINNAGVGVFGDFHQTSLASEVAMVNLNVQSLMILSKYYVQDMLKRNVGCILNVSSVAGEMPGGPMMSVYYATKAFVTAFSMGLAYELKKTHVKVSVLAPGPTRTHFIKTAMQDASSTLFSRLKFQDPETVARYAIKHLGKPLIVPGIMNKLMVYSGYFLPRSLVLFFVDRIQRAKS
ncbi:SDR family NAD(P)-dependent oxidoreductase [Pasteurella sp. PK-2025]|uniref:SDR family NAD(P)-dependent oxidoreductase n=1 Tax=Pasteurella sp. PK-2025 TaxID=3413133 RepID=UPI003C746E18